LGLKTGALRLKEALADVFAWAFDSSFYGFVNVL